MIRNNFLIIAVGFLLFSSCRPAAIKRGALLGKWKYLKVENPNSKPPDSVSSTELEIEAPYIKFSQNDSMMIWWGGRVLSHGTFRLDGNNIRVKEILEGGKTREFPFFVSKLTDKDLIFETMGDDGSKVTAAKQ
jgi:hypothetical protein